MREPLPSDAEPSESSPDAHVEAVRNEHRSELAEALAALPAQQREAVLLRDVRGFSYEEVAASLAVSTSAVESLLFRARSRLRSQLRTAYAAISGAGWLGPLRDLLGTGGLAGAPVAAKAVAVGALGAAVAGGVVAPTVLEHRPHTSPPPPTRPAAQAPPVAQAPQAPSPPVVFSTARPSLSDRPRIENVSSVSRRPSDAHESDGAAGGGDAATGEHEGGGSTGKLHVVGAPGGGESESSGGDGRTHSSSGSLGGGGGESGRSATSSSEDSSHTQTVTTPVEQESAGSGSSVPSGDSSGQSSGQPSSGESSGGDGSDG